MAENYYMGRQAHERAAAARQAEAIKAAVTATRQLSETFAQMGEQLHKLVESVQQLARAEGLGK